MCILQPWMDDNVSITRSILWQLVKILCHIPYMTLFSSMFHPLFFQRILHASLPNILSHYPIRKNLLFKVISLLENIYSPTIENRQQNRKNRQE